MCIVAVTTALDLSINNWIFSKGYRLAWQQQSALQQACPCFSSQDTAAAITAGTRLSLLPQLQAAHTTSLSPGVRQRAHAGNHSLSHTQANNPERQNQLGSSKA
jgi:hypothetical protein